MSNPAKLMFLCGKMAAGKSTLARDLAGRGDAILLVQDELLEVLFPWRDHRCSRVFGPLFALEACARVRIFCAILSKGVSVVLDFPGNTKAQRAWFREMFERAQVQHELHFIDASDELCKRQLKDRTKHLPPGTPWTTDAEFDAITLYFQPPSDDEAFNVVRHART